MPSSSLIDFWKYSGAGNDFVLIEPSPPLSLTRSAIRRLCHRQHGIGGDGLLLVERGELAPHRMRIFNADGGEAEMCGNGLRCVAKFLYDKGETPPPYQVEVSGNCYTADVAEDRVVLSLPSPTQFAWEIALDGDLLVDSIDTGVPHALIFVDALETVDVQGIGERVRYHPYFAPKGTNVDFVSLTPSGEVRLRTYERGVEGETLACGTGAVAAALAAARRLGRTSGPIEVVVRSGERLILNFAWHNSHIERVTLSGSARKVFAGRIDIKCDDGISYTAR